MTLILKADLKTREIGHRVYNETTSSMEIVGEGRNDEKYVSIDIYFLVALFLTSSSLQECNIILFGCPGVIPEWPLDQS